MGAPFNLSKFEIEVNEPFSDQKVIYDVVSSPMGVDVSHRVVE